MTDDVDDREAADVVPLVPREDDVPVRTRKRPAGHRYCGHLRVELDHDARRVYCADCEQEVPAFDALLTFARRWERYVDRRDRARDEAKHAEAKLADLKRQIRNAQATLRRATTTGGPA